ncbi:MAG: hypothetical protein AAF498_09260 [Pseudomonadota bacterium]
MTKPQSVVCAGAIGDAWRSLSEGPAIRIGAWTGDYRPPDNTLLRRAGHSASSVQSSE